MGTSLRSWPAILLILTFCLGATALFATAHEGDERADAVESGATAVLVEPGPTDRGGGIRLTFEALLGPGQTTVHVPAACLQPGTRYQLEIVAKVARGDPIIRGGGSFETSADD